MKKHTKNTEPESTLQVTNWPEKKFMYLEKPKAVRTILACGDIHCKPWILEKALNATYWDKFVFLGDACDDWTATQDDNIKTIKAIADMKKKYGDKFIWLIGNHDWGYYDQTVDMSGHIHDRAVEVWKLLCDNIDNWQIIHKDGNIWFSHAGVSWAHDSYDQEEIKRNPGGMCPLNSVGWGCGGWSSAPSPIWARPNDIAEMPNDVIQVVGHTPTPFIDLHSFNDYAPGNKMILCDTFSTTSYGKKIGDETLLKIDIFDDKNAVYRAINLDGKPVNEILRSDFYL